MALTSFAELIDGIRDWLGRANDTSNLPTSRMGDLVAMAEAEIYDRLRVREMEASAALTVDAQTVALPTDYVETRRLYLDDARDDLPLVFRAPPQFWREVRLPTTTGRPRIYTIEGSDILFGPAPDATYTGRLLYYKRFAGLASEVNTIFTARPHLYLYGALAHAAPFVDDDERIGVWRGQFEAAISQAQSASDRGSYSGAPLIIRAG